MRVATLGLFDHATLEQGDTVLICIDPQTREFFVGAFRAQGKLVDGEPHYEGELEPAEPIASVFRKVLRDLAGVETVPALRVKGGS
jgi:hypothetical protein